MEVACGLLPLEALHHGRSVRTPFHSPLGKAARDTPWDPSLVPASALVVPRPVLSTRVSLKLNIENSRMNVHSASALGGEMDVCHEQKNWPWHQYKEILGSCLDHKMNEYMSE